MADKPLDLHLFEQVADGLHSLMPPELGPWRERNHRYGIKVWVGTDAKPPREHYEAQIVSARHAPEATVLALEVGFHAEHPKPADNRAVLARLVEAEGKWRRELGDEPVAGGFLGRARDRIRVSETWPDPDMSDPDLPFELAARLTDYLVVLQKFM